MEDFLGLLDNFSTPITINNGSIYQINGEKVPYSIELGLSKSSILEFKDWKNFITKIVMQFVINISELKLIKEVLQEDIMLEDYHWNWSKKAFFYNTPGYDWFFLKTSDGIQGVCLTFHPQKSIFQNTDIFYIKYLSSAPWNRKSSLHERKYKGVGNEILKQVQYYFLQKHYYNYGFSLHSLPQAQSFYEHIGMVNLPEYNDSNGLFFYEISKENAISFLEGKNV
jgi:hypothetical protein